MISTSEYCRPPNYWNLITDSARHSVQAAPYLSSLFISSMPQPGLLLRTRRRTVSVAGIYGRRKHAPLLPPSLLQLPFLFLSHQEHQQFSTSLRLD